MQSSVLSYLFSVTYRSAQTSAVTFDYCFAIDSSTNPNSSYSENEVNASDHKQDTSSATDADSVNDDKNKENARINADTSEDSVGTYVKNHDSANIECLRVWAIEGKIELVWIDEML